MGTAGRPADRRSKFVRVQRNQRARGGGGRRREAGEAEESGENVLVISARTDAALRELAGRYAEYLEQDGEWSWAEICHTAGVGRAAMSERLAVVA